MRSRQSLLDSLEALCGWPGVTWGSSGTEWSGGWWGHSDPLRRETEAVLGSSDPGRGSLPQGTLQRRGQWPAEQKGLAKGAGQQWQAGPRLPAESPLPVLPLVLPSWPCEGELAAEDGG